MRQPAGSQRRRHLSLVLGEIQRRGAAGRNEIARGSGLSRTTVSGIVAELLAGGLLAEAPDRRPAAGSGRPTTLLTLRPDAGSLLGVHLAHDGVQVALADLRGEILDVRSVPLDMDHRPAEALGFATDAVRELADHSPTVASPVGIGVAISGPTLDGRPVTTGGLLPDWADVDVAARLERDTGLPVHVGNDANLGALAEGTYGVARDRPDFVYVMLAEGVGAGIVLGGELYEGMAGAAGELGHVLTTADGVICRCGGRGCLETVAGGPALVRALAPTRGSTTTVPDVLAWAADGDAGALRVLDDAGRAVGRALATACAVLDVDLVVVGGYAAGAGEPLIDAIREGLRATTPPALGRTIEVTAGRLGTQAELIGAIAAAGRAVVVPTLLPSV
ncbi:ROK family transcriptional regulator [Jatrophihabitans endophyticus]|uniref:ROK family transcriptional regulator n=1 Tax=Jatrophihabitans endophyticus TaxID=1206085 RepID=UPI0019E4E09E|nr:ROK family transcriptional regulator [Jatrophihabitans endophyticus]MBE7189575.1 ROK family transcriptional regulator [Jatrophihabitans endophyticus]